MVNACAAGLRALGLGKGDAVGIHLPMVPEAVVALLAIGRIGAVAVPLFSGFGLGAIASRLNDVQAKAVISCDTFPRRGTRVPAAKTLDEAVLRCPTIRHVVVVSRDGTRPPDGRVGWDDLQ